MSNYYEGFEGMKLIANAMQRSNDIREKELNFAKEQWEFNKKIQEQSSNTEISLANTMKEMGDYFRQTNNKCDVIAENQAILFKEFMQMKSLLEEIKNVQTDNHS